MIFPVVTQRRWAARADCTYLCRWKRRHCLRTSTCRGWSQSGDTRQGARLWIFRFTELFCWLYLELTWNFCMHLFAHLLLQAGNTASNYARFSKCSINGRGILEILKPAPAASISVLGSWSSAHFGIPMFDCALVTMGFFNATIMRRLLVFCIWTINKYIQHAKCM
jgi:hypothetical protein